MNWRAAFTLFEVAVSLMVLMVGLLACLALLPSGLRQQQIARQRIYTTAIAATFLDTFHKPLRRMQDMGTNGLRWDVIHTRSGTPPNPALAPADRAARFPNTLSSMLSASSAFAPDLEQSLGSAFGGAYPLPLELARRLDSPGGEIAKVLDGGGYIYAIDTSLVRGSFAGRTTALDSVAGGDELMRQLVFTVIGDPQQNALPVHPRDGWPWYERYPFPPQWKRSGQTAFYWDLVVYPDASRRNDTDMNGNGNQGDVIQGPGAFRGITITPSAREVSPVTGWHGGNWEYFVTRAPTSPWASGWAEFQELADDAAAGWLPVQSMIGSTSANYTSGDFSTNAVRTVTGGLSGALRPMPTYEMRANYRDRAIRLWQAVRPRPGTYAAIDEHPLISADAARRVVDTNASVVHYEFAPEQLEDFPVIDPTALLDGGGDFPPHPAQILALSYLAHSAMMVTGYLPPFENRTWDAGGESAQGLDPLVELRVGGSVVPKDAARVDADAGMGGTVVTVRSPDPDPVPVCYYAGDWLWVHRSAPGPGDYTDFAYEVAADVNNFADPTVPVNVTINRVWKVAEVAGGVDILGPGGVASTALTGWQRALTTSDLILRVANQADRRFARRVHEMMVRWVMAYASENPYDFGAPRPANHQLMVHHPLTTFDCWYDAGDRSSDGFASRRVRNQGQDNESFYRWINPIPLTNAGPGTHYDQFVVDHNNNRLWNPPAAAPHAWLSDFASRGWRFSNWEALALNARLAEPSAGSDARRFHLARPFDASHRTRELVFWAVDWQSYADAETAPSAPIARARAGRANYSTSSVSFDPVVRVDRFHHIPNRNDGASPLVGNPEMKRIWSSAARDQVLTGWQGRLITWMGHDTIDTLLGHWGADRNGNHRLDRGPTPASARLNAVPVARLLYYDPVLRLTAEN